MKTTVTFTLLDPIDALERDAYARGLMAGCYSFNVAFGLGMFIGAGLGIVGCLLYAAVMP